MTPPYIQIYTINTNQSYNTCRKNIILYTIIIYIGGFLHTIGQRDNASAVLGTMGRRLDVWE